MGPSRRLFFLPYALAAIAVSAPCAAAQEPADAWLGRDKALHAFAGAWTGTAGYALGVEREWAPAERRRAAVAAALGASLAKEAHDRWTRGKPFSFKDLAAGLAGAAAFVALSAAADR